MAQRGRAGGRSIILSGDVHSSWAFAGPCDPRTGEPVAVEMTTPAVSSAAMGRAHLPGMWRVLDREVNRLDHVCWADVTERGYGVLELTPGAATAEWWFVHPYADDPAGDAVAAAAMRTDRSEWPPRFERIERGADDPDRPGLLEPLPARPADLGRMRARRWVRLGAESAAMFTAATLPVALSIRARSRHRRR
jgi:hypothetical protein